ncbi:hypothetical protein K239x_15630 [Planctomycetes bacterium K23_9]|uniref:Uncharacterized protein n=1 Tax=Stieleria marina TaxID=1930275 RepID=A0A517NR60_9BACT|nr:hypothetical protein K239x_15630 [Planctomycetes bacterium K23_9]
MPSAYQYFAFFSTADGLNQGKSLFENGATASGTARAVRCVKDWMACAISLKTNLDSSEIDSPCA